MAFSNNLVRVDISQAATPVSATQTNIPLLIANEAVEWEDGKVIHTYGSLDEVEADGFAVDSDTYLYASKLLSQSEKPSTFMIGQKAGTALTTADLAAMVEQTSEFYAVILVKGTDAEIATAADWVQGETKMLFAASSSASIGDASSTSSIAYTLKDKNCFRTALMFSPGSADMGIEAAWVGGQITQQPGTNNWAYQTLDTISTDTLTTSQLLATVGNPLDEVEGNWANTYTSQYSKGVTLKGTTSGDYIDLVVGRDWLDFQMSARIFSLLASGLKNPYTNKGVAVFVAEVRSVLDEGAAVGLINPNPGVDREGKQLPGITVTVADVGTVSAQDKAARRCPTIYFTCTLTGCIDSVAVKGTVLV